MAFKCAGCNLTYPDKDEQTGTLGQPNYCPDCYDELDEEPGEEKESDEPGGTKAKKADDDDSPDLPDHLWGRGLI